MRPRPGSPAAAGGRGRRAFTIVELLVVIGIIILILSILIVAVNKAMQAAQAANTRALMNSIAQGLVRFKDDVGYLPPLLDDDRGLLLPPNPDAASYAADVQDWHSRTALPDYLVGYGDDQADAADGLGIRAPGRDGVWGATINGSGEFAARNAGAGTASAGQVLGPYIELKDERLLGGLTPVGTIVFPGEDANFDTYPKVIVDYWGGPITFHRRPYPPGALTQSYRAVDRDGDGLTDRVPTLSDVYVLRPWTVAEGRAVDGLADASGDTTTTAELSSAEFAVFSAGPDRASDATVRRDDMDENGDGFAESNQDNIVETGP